MPQVSPNSTTIMLDFDLPPGISTERPLSCPARLARTSFKPSAQRPHTSSSHAKSLHHATYKTPSSSFRIPNFYTPQPGHQARMYDKPWLSLGPVARLAARTVPVPEVSVEAPPSPPLPNVDLVIKACVILAMWRRDMHAHSIYCQYFVLLLEKL